MPGSTTTPGHMSTRVIAPTCVAFHTHNGVGTRDKNPFAAQWLACALPYRRFADALTDVCARLGADAVRYSFIVADFHRLLLAGLRRTVGHSRLPQLSVMVLRPRGNAPMTAWLKP